MPEGGSRTRNFTRTSLVLIRVLAQQARLFDRAWADPAANVLLRSIYKLSPSPKSCDEIDRTKMSVALEHTEFLMPADG